MNFLVNTKGSAVVLEDTSYGNLIQYILNLWESMTQQELTEILQYTRRQIPLHSYPVFTTYWAGPWTLNAGWGCLAAQTLLITLKSTHGISNCISIIGFNDHPASRKRRAITLQEVRCRCTWKSIQSNADKSYKSTHGHLNICSSV